ncbi:hypothetical protein [Haladaptatus sp. CMAA 1911]|uniref:hypothetical protein n=1 Tax=Haladaptatus sp. CMAA 1911 TaxID=3368987 RepID=UPI0037547667
MTAKIPTQHSLLSEMGTPILGYYLAILCLADTWNARCPIDYPEQECQKVGNRVNRKKNKMFWSEHLIEELSKDPINSPEQ